MRMINLISIAVAVQYPFICMQARNYKSISLTATRRMSTTPTPPVQLRMWRRALGCCLICGTPMETPGRKLDEAASVSRDVVTIGYGESEAYNPDSDETLKGAQQSATRVCMFKHGLLQKMQACHLVDRYTFLPASLEEFVKSLRKYKQVGSLLPMPASHSGDVTEKLITDISTKGPQGSSVYAKAAETCQSVGGLWVIAGCAACNGAMNRPVQHARVVFSMQDPSKRASEPLMTNTISRSKAKSDSGDMSKSAANAIGGLIQQLTLFFRQDAAGKWVAREPNDILETNYLYRIAANLNSWGIYGNFRFRAVAVLYASLYIRHQVEDVQHNSNFEAWHLHRFRSLYSKTFIAGTFFGMTQSEAAAVYTLNEGGRACDWINGIKERVGTFIDLMQQQDADATKALRITEFERQVDDQVLDEQSLFLFAARRWRTVEAGLRNLLLPLHYNVFNDPSARLLRHRAKQFDVEMRLVIRKLLRDESALVAKHIPTTELARLRL